jgi:beta-glucanase (GH16 family)
MFTRWLGRKVVLALLALLGVAGTAVVAPGDDSPSATSVDSVAASRSYGSNWDGWGRWGWWWWGGGGDATASKSVTVGDKPTTTTADPTTTAAQPATTEPGTAAPTTQPRRRASTTTTSPGAPQAETAPPSEPPATTAAPAPAPPTTSPPSPVPNDLPGALAGNAWSVRDIRQGQLSLGLPPGWGLDFFAPEVQRYRDKGVSFRSDGLISLDARAGDGDSPTGFTSGAITSGWLSSQPRIHRGDYGQTAMKLPGGSGMWPAFWLLDVPTPDASRTHEIDVMEAVGREPGIVYHTIHFNGQKKQLSTKLDYTQWHTYGVYLGSDATYFYVDGQLIGSTDAAPAGIEYGVMANLALGGSWAGNPDPAAFPAQVLMTPVRVWSPA